MKITTGLVPPPPPPPCASVRDCSLNGVCDARSGNCTCDAGWKGRQCAVLDLVPAASLDGCYQHKYTSSWGGLPLRGPVRICSARRGPCSARHALKHAVEWSYHAAAR